MLAVFLLWRPIYCNVLAKLLGWIRLAHVCASALVRSLIVLQGNLGNSALNVPVVTENPE